MHRELVRIPRLTISRAHEAGHDELLAVVRVVPSGKMLDEKQDLRPRVRKRHAAQGEILIALDRHQPAAVHKVLYLRRLAAECEVFVHSDLVLLLHRRARATQSACVSAEWNRGGKR